MKRGIILTGLCTLALSFASTVYIHSMEEDPFAGMFADEGSSAAVVSVFPIILIVTDAIDKINITDSMVADAFAAQLSNLLTPHLTKLTERDAAPVHQSICDKIVEFARAAKCSFTELYLSIMRTFYATLDILHHQDNVFLRALHLLLSSRDPSACHKILAAREKDHSTAVALIEQQSALVEKFRSGFQTRTELMERQRKLDMDISRITDELKRKLQELTALATAKQYLMAEVANLQALVSRSEEDRGYFAEAFSRADELYKALSAMNADASSVPSGASKRDPKRTAGGK
jgi:hypothetical protein